MVNQQNMENSIIKVFEEHEEQFFFPVTSQKDARAFIKALHIKGIQYDNICEEIGEFEHNFSAWRKGLGRAGIGNRVIELINKPFQQILLSDSEDSDDEGMNGSTNPATKTRLQNVVDKSQANGDTVVRPRVEERLPLHQDRTAQKEKQGEITSSWMKTVDQKTSVIRSESPTEQYEVESDNDRNSFKEETITKKEPLQKQEAKEEKFTLETVRLRRVEKKTEEPKVVLREKEGNFERTLSFREKLQKARERESKTLSGGITRDSPPATPELNGSSGVPQDEERATFDKPDPALDDTTDSRSEDETLEEPMKINDKSEKRQTQESESEEEEDFQMNRKEENQKSDTSDEDEEDSSEDQEEIKTDKPDGMDHREESEASTDSSSVGEGPAIDENYDSDLDDENDESGEELGELRKGLAALKEQNVDGDGYIYIFSDGSNDDVYRVKVGASRFPNKRLEQAKSFNLMIKLVSASPVSQRKRALADLQQLLKSYQLNDSAGWYEAPLNDILEIVPKVTTKYPSEQSDC